MNAIAEPLQIERTAIDGAVNIPVELLRPNPWNRKRYDAPKFAQLVDSVRKHGVIQPIIVRAIEGATVGQPLYEIVAGERRWRAAKEAAIALMPALLRTLTDLELLELLLTENAEREEMNALDEAECLERMLLRGNRLQGYATVDELAARVGRSRAYIFQRLKLLTLCDEARQALLDSRIEASHALIIARIPSAEDQRKALHDIEHGFGGTRLSVRDAQIHVQRHFMLSLGRATFPITSATLVADTPACGDCPKRTGTNPDLFADVQATDTCTDPACYHAKEAAHREDVKAQATARGLYVMTGAEAKKLKPAEYGQPKGLLALDQVHHQLGDKPLRKLLGRDVPQVLLYEDPHNHSLTEMVREDDAVHVLKCLGKLKANRMPTTAASQREAQVKRKSEVEWRSAVAQACVDAAGTEVGLAAEYRTPLITRVALRLWMELHSDTRTRVAKLMAWPPIKGHWDQGPGLTAEAHFGTLDAPALTRYFTAATLASEMAVNDYSGKQEPALLKATAEALGVDVPGIRKAMAKPTRVVPEKAAAARARKQAAQPTPETALAAALKAPKPLKNGKLAVKYRNPATGDSWSGRGLKPKWLTVALDAGAELSDFDVAQPAKTPAPGSAAGKPSGDAP